MILSKNSTASDTIFLKVGLIFWASLAGRFQLDLGTSTTSFDAAKSSLLNAAVYASLTFWNAALR